jgi:hypothetical protein
MADDSWYYAQNNQQLGPVTLDALRSMVASGQVGAADLVWKQGMPQWVPARSVPEIASVLPGGGGMGAGMGMGAGATPTMSSSPAAGGYSPGYAPPGAYPPGGGYYPPGAQNFSGKATTAMWLGIASLPLCLCPLVGIGLGIAAIIVGNKVPEGPDKGRAKTGVICGTIGVAIGVLNAIAGVMMQFGKFPGVH